MIRLIPYYDDPLETLDDLDKELDDYLDYDDFSSSKEYAESQAYRLDDDDFSSPDEYIGPEALRTDIREERLANASRAVNAREDNLAIAYDLYIMLLLLQERATNNFPSYEGILLMKERKQADK